MFYCTTAVSDMFNSGAVVNGGVSADGVVLFLGRSFQVRLGALCCLSTQARPSVEAFADT